MSAEPKTSEEQIIAASLYCSQDCVQCPYFMPCGIRGRISCLKAQTAYNRVCAREGMDHEVEY